MGPLGSGLEWTGCSSWLGRTSLHRHWLTVCLVLLSCVVRVGWTTSLEEKRFYAERHKNAVLMAGFHGYQKKVKNVQWKRGNNSVLFYDSGTKMFGQYANRARYDFDNNTLILENVTGEDVGLYEVSLVTENATLVKMVLYLEVIAALSEPRISISFGNSSWAGLNMTCEVSGGKDLSYWWLKDGQPLPQDGRHSVREGNWSLQISNLTHRDCTNYSCVVANRLRSREAHALVTAANISLCEPMRDVQSQPLRNRDLLSLCAGLLCVVGMCLVIYCVRRHGQERWSCSTTPESKQEEHVYNEVIYMQVEDSSSEAARVPYVYMDYLPNRGSQRSRVEPELDDFGYSSIGPLVVDLQPEGVLPPAQ